jgi:hypothetical protein
MPSSNNGLGAPRKMIISILETRTISKFSKLMIVRFSCEFGTASAEWHGRSPAIGASMDVELACDPCVGPGASPEVKAFSILEIEEGAVALVGQVEDIADDEMLILRIGDDLLRCECSSHEVGKGDWLRVESGCLHLYDTSY